MMWCAGYSLNPFTYNWTIKLTGDTATVAKWRANNDSVLNWSTKVSDTFRVVPRWSAFSNHDSTFKWMNIDTIPSADTIAVKNLKVDKIDSVYSPKGISVKTGTFSGMINVNDSIDATKGIKSNGVYSSIGIFTNVVDVDSLKSTKGIKAPTFYGNLSGNVTGNVSGSSGSCLGNSVTATNLVGGPNTQKIRFKGATIDSSIQNISTLFGFTINGMLLVSSSDGYEGNAIVCATNTSCKISLDASPSPIFYNDSTSIGIQMWRRANGDVMMRQKSITSAYVSFLYLGN